MRLTRINLNGKVYELENLVVIVGPNGTGKTSLLYDLFAQAVTHTKLNASSNLTYKWQADMFRDDFYELTRTETKQWLSEQQVIEGQKVNNEDVYASRYSPTQAQGYALPQTELDNLKSIVDDESQMIETDGTYAPKIKGSYFNHASVDSRFRISKESGFNYQDRKPSSFFWHNKPLLDNVNRFLNSYFSKRIFVEYSNPTSYQLLVGRSDTPNPAIYKNDSNGITKTLQEFKQWRMDYSELQSPSDEGHGVRAFIEVITALIDPYQKVLFIDEPELHLYPDIKRRLGTDIAKFTKQKQIFLVTHDTDIVDSLINSEVPFDILRIKPGRNIDFIEFKKPAIKTIHAEKKTPDALKVGFYDCAVFVEGVGDRYVYGNAFELKRALNDYSSTFVACNGKDRIANHIKFALKVNIPVAVLLDYDSLYGNVLLDLLKLYLTYSQFAVHRSIINQLIVDVEYIQTNTSGIPDKTKGLAGDLTRYPSGMQTRIKGTLTTLKALGMFLVPIGELEDWTGSEKGTLPEEIFRKYVSRSNSKYRPLTDYLLEVGGYLRTTIES